MRFCKDLLFVTVKLNIFAINNDDYFFKTFKIVNLILIHGFYIIYLFIIAKIFFKHKKKCLWI